VTVTNQSDSDVAVLSIGGMPTPGRGSRCRLTTSWGRATQPATTSAPTSEQDRRRARGHAPRADPHGRGLRTSRSSR
jgi:hypothetical protein